MHVFGGWEEVGVPAGNPHKHRENKQTPERNLEPTTEQRDST